MDKKIKILILSNLWPSFYHTSRAANIVIFELIKGFCLEEGIETGFLKLNHPKEFKDISVKEKEGIEALKRIGLKVLEPLSLPALSSASKLRKVFKFFKPEPEDFYPEIRYQKIIEEKILDFSSDIIFIPWSEWITSACAGIKIPKFAYYGNPDPKVGLYRLLFSYKHCQVGLLKFLLLKKLFKNFEKIHNETIQKYEILGNVAANDAEYYIKNGHPNAFYIQNIWINRFGEAWREKRKELEKEKPAVIVGSIGKLDGTANQYGLEILGRYFLPELKKRMKPGSYEVHIFGAGKILPSLEKYFRVAEVKIRGFVEDIDNEILSAPVFLCLNNASPYKVGHTRYLHAWSLGACVVAHQDSSLSMPEIIHGKNALLGKDIEEIADLVVKAISDRNLREKIGRGGYQTFKEKFTTEKVTPKIISKIREFFKEND